MSLYIYALIKLCGAILESKGSENLCLKLLPQFSDKVCYVYTVPMTHKSAYFFVRPDPEGSKVMPLIQNSYIFMFTVVLYYVQLKIQYSKFMFN